MLRKVFNFFQKIIFKKEEEIIIKKINKQQILFHANKIHHSAKRFLKKIFDETINPQIQIFIVGGFIRDFYCKKNAKDIDILIFGQTLEEVETYFKKYKYKVFPQFGMIKIFLKHTHIDIQVIEKFTQNSIRNNLKKRDLTINSLIYNIKTRECHDYFGGFKDIQNKTLSAIDRKQFTNDSKKVLRLIYYHCWLGWKIEENLKKILTTSSHKIDSISPYWQKTYWKQIFLSTQNPHIGLQYGKLLGGFLVSDETISITEYIHILIQNHWNHISEEEKFLCFLFGIFVTNSKSEFLVFTKAIGYKKGQHIFGRFCLLQNNISNGKMITILQNNHYNPEKYLFSQHTIPFFFLVLKKYNHINKI